MRPAPLRPSRGFSLVELLAVVTLVGTLSVQAVPALVSLHSQAEDTLLASLAASAGSAAALNQAGCLVTGHQPAPGRCQPVRDCADVAGLLMTPLPPGYRLLAQPLTAEGGHCQLQRDDDGASALFHGARSGG